ncbi:hypothetical protein QM012_001393 [Aureobasidium pullulans]|uniref:NADAR domain-containing protein n=1 Tax=Aureobasidium pullulans TaxID=5580 RepID=A0ABR0TDY1_AURPU
MAVSHPFLSSDHNSAQDVPPNPPKTLSEPVYFFGTTERPYGIFSQFKKCTFTDPNYPNVKFNCSEQYMMYSKAQTFSSPSIAAQILVETASAAQKKLGRQIKDFSDAVWDNVKFGIVERGNYLKFSQNEKFKEVLLETGDRLLVEAAANDKIWGIGFSAAGAKKVSREIWGQNLLGKALMNVREKIRAEEAGEDEDEEADESAEQATDEEADEEADNHPAIPIPSTANRKRKHDPITNDESPESKKTPSKKARISTIADANKGLHRILNKTKGQHDEDERITEDDLLEMLTKKAAEDSMIYGSGR